MPNLYVWSITISVILAILMMIYAVVRHTVEKSRYLIFLSVANLFFVFGNLLEMTGTTLENAFYGVRVQYMGAPFIMPLTYLFLRDLYGKKRLTSMGHALLLLIPVLSMVALQAFPIVRLQYGEIWYSTNGQIVNVQHTNGIAYYLGTALNYTCIFLSLRLVLRRIRHGGRSQSRQSLVLLAGWLAPLTANASYVFLSGVRGFDLTPIVYVTSMAVFLYSALARNLLNVLPLARAQVMDELEDAFVVCDEDLHFLDANLSARRLFPELATLVPGDSMAEVKGFQREGKMQRWAGGEERHYKVTSNPILRDIKDSAICVVFRNVTVESRLLDNLKRQAELDALTGFYNRGTFFAIARESMKQHGKPLAYALLMIDVDHFKRVNDNYGHPCGDAVLREIAEIAKNHFRKGDVIGRYGGEEFAILLKDLSGEQAVAVAEEFRKAVENTAVRCQEQTVRVTISIGAAHCPGGDNQTLESLLTQADEALYLSKSTGRNRSSLYQGKEVVL